MATKTKSKKVNTAAKQNAAIRAKWSRLTDEDLDPAQWQRESLIRRLRDRYGWSEEQAENEVTAFESQ